MPLDVSQTTEKVTKRLFFTLESADAVSKCLVAVQPKTETIKGRLEDLWDKGAENVFWWALLTPLAVGIFGAAILLIIRQYLGALMFFGICALMMVGMGTVRLILDYGFDEVLPVYFSYLMAVIVSLLGIEWLARKLLRLA